MEPHSLPVELIDRIIDFCHEDKKTLSSCALTHSLWLPASRFHLFHTITSFRPRERTNRLKSIISQSRFTRSCRQSTIIRYIGVVEVESLTHLNQEVLLRDSAHLIQEILRFCTLEGLPGPSVHVNIGYFQLGPEDLTSSLSLVCDIVTRVKLRNVISAHPNAIWSFLSSLPKLQCLELLNVGLTHSAKYSLPAEGTFDGIPLSTLRITTASAGFIISSIARVADSLTHLDDFGIAYQDIRQDNLPQLAKAIQERVKCLRFSASCYSGEKRGGETRPFAFDIRIPEFVGRFRSLDTLVLDNINLLDSGPDYYDGSDGSFEWIPGVLQQLSSPIQKLVFEVTVSHYWQLDAIPWMSIDNIVNPKAPQFRELNRVEVLLKCGIGYKSFSPSISKDAVCSEILQRLPALNLQGLLRCDTAGC